MDLPCQNKKCENHDNYGCWGWGGLPLMAGMEPHSVQSNTDLNRALETLSCWFSYFIAFNLILNLLTACFSSRNVNPVINHIFAKTHRQLPV